MPKPSVSFAKRQREQAKRERQQMKAARKAERKTSNKEEEEIPVAEETASESA